MSIVKFTDGKSRREHMPGWPIDGKPVRRLIGMIYWYGWGDDRDFDIRKVRKALDLPEESKHDKWFMKKKPNSCSAFSAQMMEIQEALHGRDFTALLDDIDSATEACGQPEASIRKPFTFPPLTEDYPL